MISTTFAFEEILAILGFITAGMVELFDLVMSFRALRIVAIWFYARDMRICYFSGITPAVTVSMVITAA